MQDLLENDEELANSQQEDNTHISTILMILYTLKASILIIVLGCLSYFIGILWYIVCDLKLDYEVEDNFIAYFGLKELPN